MNNSLRKQQSYPILKKIGRLKAKVQGAMAGE